MSAARASLALMLLASATLAGCDSSKSVGENLIDWQVKAKVENDKAIEAIKSANEKPERWSWPGTRAYDLREAAEAEAAAAAGQQDAWGKPIAPPQGGSVVKGYEQPQEPASSAFGSPANSTPAYGAEAAPPPAYGAAPGAPATTANGR